MTESNMEVSRREAQEITVELQVVVADVFKKYGLTAPRTRTTYGSIYKVSFESSKETLDEKGINLTSKEALAYLKLHELYGLPAGLLGTVFSGRSKNGQEDYTFIGIASSRSKYPFAARNENGETVFFTEVYKDVIIKAASL